jgi:hypothetical protein
MTVCRPRQLEDVTNRKLYYQQLITLSRFPINVLNMLLVWHAPCEIDTNFFNFRLKRDVDFDR